MNDVTDPLLDGELDLARTAQPSWSLARQQQVIWGVRGRLQTHRRRMSALLLSASVAVVLGLGWVGFKTFSGDSPGGGVASIGAERWNLRDGSEIVIESPTTVIKKKRESETEILFELEAGTAHFEVVSKPQRVFRVNAGAATVEVVGTSFRVARKQSRSEVTVDRGRVIVSWNGGSRMLNQGERGTFPPDDALTRTSTEAAVSATAARDTPSVRSEPAGAEALFANADKARKEGRPDQAIGFLKSITDRHPSDPRAPLAAFTRGRVLLESLGRPREAAQAFAQARGLSGKRSALAEDALAREVEAYAKAGEAGLAHDRAELYRRNYPKGLRLHQVIRSGGLQDAP
jgi:transmembrane sensor